MSQRIRIASKAELPQPGEAREFDAAGKMVCVANSGGTITAMDNMCLHRGAPLGQGGVVLDGKVVCAWHGWGWDAQTGACSLNPDYRLAVYPVKIEGDDVWLEL